MSVTFFVIKRLVCLKLFSNSKIKKFKEIAMIIAKYGYKGTSYHPNFVFAVDITIKKVKTIREVNNVNRLIFLLFITKPITNPIGDRKSTRLNSSHVKNSSAVF